MQLFYLHGGIRDVDVLREQDLSLSRRVRDDRVEVGPLHLRPRDRIAPRVQDQDGQDVARDGLKEQE